MSLRSVCVEHVCTQIQLWVCIHTMHACLCLGASLGCGAHYKKTALWQRLFQFHIKNCFWSFYEQTRATELQVELTDMNPQGNGSRFYIQVSYKHLPQVVIRLARCRVVGPTWERGSLETAPNDPFSLTHMDMTQLSSREPTLSYSQAELPNQARK